MRPAIFFDRDGILNHVVLRGSIISSPRSMDELEILEEALQAVINFKLAGFTPIIITNQPDIGRGLVSLAEVQSINREIQHFFGIDHIYMSASHSDADFYRKPNPGMIFQASKDLYLNLSASVTVGDNEKDVVAGNRAGTLSVLLRTEYNSGKASTARLEVSSLGLLAKLAIQLKFLTIGD